MAGGAGSSEVRPFLRWAGAKRSHSESIVDCVPASFKTYYEPFLGSGAVFFRLQPARAVLGDRIGELIRTYRAVRDGPDAVMRKIDAWSVDRETYYEVRSLTLTNRFERAARFVYLNKTCWNGLYRVNSRGEFNVPYGRPKSNLIVTTSQLKGCAAALRGDVELVSSDFEDSLQRAGKGDLVFLDPPYVTAHENNGFVDYNERIFSWSDQERLREVVERLATVGAHVILTNADHASIRDLYRGFEIRAIRRHSTLAGSSAARRPVSELVITAGKRS